MASILAARRAHVRPRLFHVFPFNRFLPSIRTNRHGPQGTTSAGTLWWGHELASIRGLLEGWFWVIPLYSVKEVAANHAAFLCLWSLVLL